MAILNFNDSLLIARCDYILRRIHATDVSSRSIS